jgi:type II secretory pathway component PulK
MSLTKRAFHGAGQARATQESPAVPAGRNGEQGLALVLVLSLIGVILALLAEVLFESEVVSRASIGERDRVRAEMAATTGAQLAMFFVTLEGKVKNLRTNPSLPEAARSAVEAMQKDMESQMGGRSLAQLLNDFPIGSEGFDAIEDLAKLNLRSLTDEKLIAALSAVPGYFVVHVSDESSKLNVNLFSDRSLSKHMRNALLRIFSGAKEKEFLQSLDIEPERLVSNLQDYIDSDQLDSGGGGDESFVYQQAKLKHSPKNGPLESLDELRRVPGFHLDDVFDVFSPYFTVWPMKGDQGQWNINKASGELVAAVTTTAEGQVNDALIDRFEDKIAGGETFSKKEERNFFDFFKAGGSGDKDTDEILRWIAGFESTVYRIVVRGVSNQVERTLEMVAVYEEQLVGGGGAAGAGADGGGAQGPGADESGQPVGNDGGAPTPSPKPRNNQPREGKMRIVFQRFR